MPESAVLGVHAAVLTYIVELFGHDFPRVFLQMATLRVVFDFSSTGFIMIDQLPGEWIHIKGKEHHLCYIPCPSSLQKLFIWLRN